MCGSDVLAPLTRDNLRVNATSDPPAVTKTPLMIPASATDEAGGAPRPEDSALTKSAGRGGLALSLSKMVFLVNGLAQQIALSWILKDAYGGWRGALSPATITYNTLVTAGILGMSRAVSRAGANSQSAAVRRGLTLHFAVAALAGAGFFLLAPVLGEWLGSAYLVPAFRILSLVVFFYGMYAPLVGVLNGQRRFLVQAGLDILTGTLRTIALCLGAWWLVSRGHVAGILGASWGFAVVTLLVFALSWALVGFGRAGPGAPGVKEHLGFILPVMGGQIVLNLLLQADTNTLRGFATRAAVAKGLGAEAADPLVGAYNAGQLFGFLPYQLLIGITFILFPMLARAHSEGDTRSVATFTQTGVRLAVIVTGAVVSVTSGLSRGLMRVVFPPQFEQLGTESLEILSLGLGCFALFGVFTTVLNSLGKQWWALTITGAGLSAVVGCNLLFVSGMPFGDNGSALVTRTALSTSIGVGVSALLAGVAVHRVAGAVVAPIVVLRVVASVAICIFSARALPQTGRLLTVMLGGGVIALYLTLLTILREIGASDLARVKTIVSFRR
jgi:stage V sporulation protein B